MLRLSKCGNELSHGLCTILKGELSLLDTALQNHFAFPKGNVVAFSAVRCAVKIKLKWTKAKQSERNQYPS